MTLTGTTLQREPEQRNWTSVGVEHGITEERRPLVDEAIESLRWHEKEEDMRLPFMPGEAINTFVEQTCGWKGVWKLAWNGVVDLPDPHPEANGEMAHYGLYGVEKRFANGLARIYLLDTGTSTLCVRSDFWPKEAA